MQVSLQPTHSLANMKMKPKHCVSNSAYCNQTSELQIHYTNNQQFETVLNYRIVAIGYVKWEKFVSFFRWRIHQSISKYSTLLPKHLSVCSFSIRTQIHAVFKMRKSLWSYIYVVRYQQNPLNKFTCPYIQYVFSLIFPKFLNNSTDIMPDYTDFGLLQNLCLNLNISTL